MSAISSVAPQQSFAPPQPTTQPARTAGAGKSDQQGGPAPAPSQPSGRLVNLTA